MYRCFYHMAFAASFLLVLLAVSVDQAHADIQYDYLTTLVPSRTLHVRPDRPGLYGATAHIQFSIPTSAIYTAQSLGPGVGVVNPRITLSGSSVAANNRTYLLGSTFFVPIIGFVPETGGILHTITLPSGDLLDINGVVLANPIGANVKVGDVVAPEQFAPATTYFGYIWDSTNPAIPNQASFYEPSDTVITAFEDSAVAPEPSTLALFCLSLLTPVRRLANRR